ncbi:hypothetical protein GQ53DRAFT_866536 [Thozetella sp. PMI_491]|nr:hypothetical protein GQ53DRAFT_866536 [Thozetella sp. PMI_491]
MSDSEGNDSAHEVTLPSLARGPRAVDIKDVFIKERIDRWRLKAETLDRNGLLEKMAQMSFSSPLNSQPGLIIPNLHGDYEYIPLERGDTLAADTPEDHLRVVIELRLFFHHAANAQLVKEIEAELDREIADKCFWEFLDTENATNMSFVDKVELVAEYRLAGRHADIAPYHRRIDENPNMNVIVYDVSGYGNTESKQMSFPWNESDSQILLAIEAFSPPEISAGLVKLVDGRDTKGWPPSMVERIKSVLIRPNVQQRHPDDPDFIYCVSTTKHEHAGSPARASISGEPWGPLKIAEMRKRCKETGGWALLIRPWKRRLAEAWSEIQRMEKEEYNATMEKGEIYFTSTGERFSFDDEPARYSIQDGAIKGQVDTRRGC